MIVADEKNMIDDNQTSLNVSNDTSISDQSKYEQAPFGINSTMARIVMAEALGTFILMFCICGILATTEIMKGRVGLIEYAVTATSTVIVVVFSIGPISGAHVNPAVTIAFATAGPFPWSKVPLYILAQTFGATGAAFVGKLVYGIKSELMTTRPVDGGWASAFFLELIATFIILFVACSLINESQSVGALSGVVVGVAIGLGVLITGPISGGSMNPARSLGPAIVSWDFRDVWIYVTAPTIGAVAGAFTFRLLCLDCRVSYRASASPAPTLMCT